MSQNVCVEIKDQIALVTIDRAASYNTFNTAVFQDVAAAVTQCGQDPSVSVVVITGAGKAFSAGGDIAEFNQCIQAGTYMGDDLIGAAGAMASAVRNCPVPVIAMVNGSAAGAGCGLALACDFRVMSTKAKLVTAFTDIAVSGDTCTLYFLGKMLGTSRMMRYAISGDPISAEEALSLGLAYAVATPEELVDTTMALAAKLAKKPRGAVAQQKKYVNRFLYPDMEDVITFERHSMTACSRLNDFTEAVQAFLEKRPPNFKNDMLLP